MRFAIPARPAVFCIALALTVLSVSRASAQQQGWDPDFIAYVDLLERLVRLAEDQEFTHPVQLAVREWERLDLTDAEVDRLTALERRMIRAIIGSTRSSATQSPPAFDIMWRDVTPTDADLESWTVEAARGEVALMRQLLDTRDTVFAILGPVRTDLLRQIAEERRGRSASATGPAPRPCTNGNMGGGSILSRRTRLAYSMSLDGDTATINALFVGRADARVAREVGEPTRAQLPDSVRMTSGGSMGIWTMVVDRQRGTAWVHEQPVPLNGANVILIQGYDRYRENPTVAGLTSIPARFFTGGCTDGQRVTEKLLEYIMTFPEIRAFLEG